MQTFVHKADLYKATKLSNVLTRSNDDGQKPPKLGDDHHPSSNPSACKQPVTLIAALVLFTWKTLLFIILLLRCIKLSENVFDLEHFSSFLSSESSLINYSRKLIQTPCFIFIFDINKKVRNLKQKLLHFYFLPGALSFPKQQHFARKLDTPKRMFCSKQKLEARDVSRSGRVYPQ